MATFPAKPANGNRQWEIDLDPLCHSCFQEEESCSQVLRCTHAGRVEALMTSIILLQDWMTEMETNPVLVQCIVGHAKGRGGRSLQEVCRGKGEQYKWMVATQDTIGWRKFMEGMICQDWCSLQERHSIKDRGLPRSSSAWASSLVVRLLEITHGQWLYRCIQVHDRLQGTLITARKEDLQRRIKEE